MILFTVSQAAGRVKAPPRGVVSLNWRERNRLDLRNIVKDKNYRGFKDKLTIVRDGAGHTDYC